jgi:hypothetical protein
MSSESISCSAWQVLSAMPGRTPFEAYFDLIDPFQKALNFIAVGRLSMVRERRDIRIGFEESVSFNYGSPVPLSSSTAGPFFLAAGLHVEVTQVDVGREPFDCRMTGYSYAITTTGDRDVLCFHWAPGMSGNQRSFPHLHIGSIVSRGSQVLPDRFNKLHIPTGIVPVSSLVRCAIQEFGVKVRSGVSTDAALQELERLDQLS